jgi:glutamate carboxypeptidase
MTEIDEVARIQARIQELLANPKTPGIKVAVSGGVTRPPMNPSVEALRLCNTVDEIAERLDIAFEWIATGGASDANITAALGVPSIDGLGPIGGLSHTVDEYLEITSVEPRLKLLCELIKDIANR